MPRKRYPATASEIFEAVDSLPEEERGIYWRKVRLAVFRDAIPTEEEFRLFNAKLDFLKAKKKAEHAARMRTIGEVLRAREQQASTAVPSDDSDIDGTTFETGVDWAQAYVDLYTDREKTAELVVEKLHPHLLALSNRPLSSGPASLSAATISATQADEPPSPAVIWSLGERQYQVDGYQPVAVTENEDTVLQALAEQPAMDEPTLREKTGLENAAKVLRELRSKYQRAFKTVIRIPGRKGQGGYFAVVEPYP